MAVEKSYGNPAVTRDRVTVAREVEIRVRFEALGTRTMREAATPSRSNWPAGAEQTVVRAVRAGTGAYGYDAATGEYGDLVERGVIDPAKVVRMVPKSAAAAARTLLAVGPGGATGRA
ncbi:hypothetical protein [Kitasatospora sp. NPDC096204]|uniref:hypothetical protein n=1 Tax=Kitasatospora sp. NPDC096204 TaxID=3364094 RepID=UPI0037F466D1